jgi:hypothetical protein
MSAVRSLELYIYNTETPKKDDKIIHQNNHIKKEAQQFLGTNFILLSSSLLLLYSKEHGNAPSQ